MERPLPQKCVELLAQGLLRSQYPLVVVEGEENLSKDRAVTIVSTHSNFFDIPAHDAAIRRTKGTYPRFIMRDNLQVLGLSVERTQYLFSHFLQTAIPLDQSDPHGFKKILPVIKDTYEERIPLVLFPGATRKFGALNGLFPRATQVFLAALYRNGLADNTVLVPSAVTYHTLYVQVTYCEPILISRDFRGIAETVTQRLADITKTDLTKLVSADEALAAIKNRE